MNDKVNGDFSTWLTSSYCASNNCVEVSLSADAVGMRDSKNRTQPALVYNMDQWRDFVAGVRDGEFDVK
jgi:hypothetical protein